MDMNRQEWKEKAAEMSGVPKDVAMGLPILTITGTNDLCVENYRGMTEYTDQIIRLQSKSGQIKITGKKLEVIYYTNDEMKIHGDDSELFVQFSAGQPPIREPATVLVTVGNPVQLMQEVTGMY